VSVCLYSCLSYPTCNAHATYYIPICGLSGCAIFFTLSHKRHDFREGGDIFMNVKCAFIFSLQFLCEIFLILRRIQRDTIINVKRSSSKVAIILVRFY